MAKTLKAKPKSPDPIPTYRMIRADILLNKGCGRTPADFGRILNGHIPLYVLPADGSDFTNPVTLMLDPGYMEGTIAELVAQFEAELRRCVARMENSNE